jgi:Lsr2
MAAVKVTIDSSEPLSDALRVLGAMYDATVVVAEDGMSAPTPPAKGGLSPASPKARVGRARKNLAAQPATSVNNVEVRSWALENGITVSNRGRLPARVVAAFRDAHQL